MARLDGLGLIRIVKHKKGRVSRCILLPRTGDPRPIRLLAYLGTRYSYLERLDCGRAVWTLRKLRQTEARTIGPSRWHREAKARNALVLPRKRHTAQHGAYMPPIRHRPGLLGTSSRSAAAGELMARFRYRLALNQVVGGQVVTPASC